MWPWTRALAGRTAVVTGGAGGIGAATARRLLRSGVHVALVDVDAARLEALVAELGGGPLRVSAHVADVRRVADHEAVVEAVLAHHGAAHFIVLNAGVTTHGALVAQSHDDLTWVVETNLLGVMHGARVWLPRLIEQGEGQIVAIASMAGLMGTPMQAAYAASKAGIRAFCQSLRVEVAGSGVGVTAVLPGTTATGFLHNARSRDESLGFLARMLPRVGASPDGVARGIVGGIVGDRAEVLVGFDTRAVDAVMRAAPAVIPAALGVGWRVKAWRGRG